MRINTKEQILIRMKGGNAIESIRTNQTIKKEPLFYGKTRKEA